ncbi:extracellular signal-regulated kinase 2-like isoform X2 [Dysidea avara]
MFLQAFSSHENVIKLLNVIKADNDYDIYLVFEFMDTDLHAAIKAKILQDVHKQYILYQLFKVLKYLHSGNVIHRDLKPSNVLLNVECFVKLADFGLARSLDVTTSADQASGNALMTDYVATRWYRAPEILLASSLYTKGVDMWSLGCILAEMVSGKPLFAGSSTINQIDKIMCCIAPPSRHDVQSIQSPYATSILSQVGRRRKSTFAELLPTADPLIIDLVGKLLQFNPTRRLTTEQALEHPYVAKFHDKSDEPSLDHNIIPLLNDNVQLSVEEYRDNLYESVRRKRLEFQQARDVTTVIEDTAPDEQTSVQESCHPPPPSHATLHHPPPPGNAALHHPLPSGHTTLHSHSATQLGGGRKSTQQHKSILKSLSSSELVARRPPVSTSGLRAVQTKQHKTRENNEISINKVPFTSQYGVSSHLPRTRPSSGNQGAVAKGNQPLDLCVVSGRIEYSERQLPHHRKLQLANKKAARGAASRYAPGMYSQAFGVISQKDLHSLKHT